MTTTTTTLHRSLAALKLPNTVPALISYAQGIVKEMTGNTAFPFPTPTLAVVTQAITDLQTAETSALARTEGAVAVRNEKRAALVTLLQADDHEPTPDKPAPALAVDRDGFNLHAGVHVKAGDDLGRERLMRLCRRCRSDPDAGNGWDPGVLTGA